MLLNPMITFSLTSILWIGVCAAPSPFQPFISRFPRYDYGLSVAQLFERQAGGAFQAVTGAGYDPANDGPVPARKEIREFEKDANQWTLFLLALDAMQATSQDDPLSWYKIAGIHGLPYELYDSVQAVEGNEDRGYCPHMSELFLPWHRPYLALFEQVLHSHMERIATLFPESERSQYVEAARTARMPYWDWAIDPVDGQSVLPASVQSESVVIGGPNGTQEIGNPLHSYRFHPFDPVELATPMLPHFETWDHTIRAPSNLEPSAISQHAFIEELLASYRESNKPRLYNLFGRYTNFTAFSNSAWIINELGRSDSMDYENYDSIESLHDLIHGIIGLGGHMTVVDLSAFDPMFMLHHAMVDRVFAMWQAVHSTSYVQPEPEIMDSFTLRRGQIVDSTTPLSPFRDRTGNLWTSDSVKRTETFGYTYEDSRREDGMSDAAYSQKVVEIINVLYAPDVPLEPPTSTATESVSQPTASSSVLSSATVQPSLNSTVSEITTTFTTATSPVPPQPTTTTRSRNPGVAPSRQLVRRQRGYADPPKTHREYLAAVRASKSMLDKPFFVHLFLGNVPSTDPRLWISAPNRVGSHASFRSARHHGHAGIEQMTVAASIPITRHIMNRALNGEMAGLAHEEVLEYLKKNLKYRVVTVDGEVADRAAVNDKLSVEVVSGLVRQRASNLEFPKWDKLEKLCSLNATV